jgi:hypothetical protein
MPGHFRPSLLKFSDEQTVASLAAVLAAVDRFGLHSVDFTGWGVVSAPRWLGRPKLVAALNKFDREGPAVTSPMLVPHLSLHAVSGTISQILRIHGPNFGTGSGISHLREGILASLTLLSGGALPGIWLTLSQWDPEPPPDIPGQVPASCVCYAVAMALVPMTPDVSGPRLRLQPAATVHDAAAHTPDVCSLADFLDSAFPAAGWLCPLGQGRCAELTGTLAIPSACSSKLPAEAQR